jgi:uncharacterized membrane protein YphA (DoxX/SURF4 family)
METMQTAQKVRSVFNILKLTYGLVPIIAGLDKFSNLLTNWEQYLNPALAQALPFSPHTFMMIVGVIEITAGVIVLLKPAVGGYIVMAWLSLIGISLLASQEYLDVAVRDLVMAVGAYSFVQVAKIIGTAKTHSSEKRETATVATSL